MNKNSSFFSQFISNSWDTWTLVFLVVAMVILPHMIYPFSRARLILVIILLILGHINKCKFGVRVGFMAFGLIIGLVNRIV